MISTLTMAWVTEGRSSGTRIGRITRQSRMNEVVHCLTYPYSAVRPHGLKSLKFLIHVLGDRHSGMQIGCRRLVSGDRMPVINEGTYLHMERGLTLIHSASPDRGYVCGALEYWTYFLDQRPIPSSFVEKYTGLLAHLLEVDNLSCCSAEDSWAPRYPKTVTSYGRWIAPCLELLYRPRNDVLTEDQRRYFRQSLLRCLGQSLELCDMESFASLASLLQVLFASEETSTPTEASWNELKLVIPLIISKLKDFRDMEYWPISNCWSILTSFHEREWPKPPIIQSCDEDHVPLAQDAEIVGPEIDPGSYASHMLRHGVVSALLGRGNAFLHTRIFRTVLSITWEGLRRERLGVDGHSELLMGLKWKFWLQEMRLHGIRHITRLKKPERSLEWQKKLQDCLSWMLRDIPDDVHASGVLEEYFRRTRVRIVPAAGEMVPVSADIGTSEGGGGELGAEAAGREDGRRELGAELAVREEAQAGEEAAVNTDASVGAATSVDKDEERGVNMDAQAGGGREATRFEKGEGEGDVNPVRQQHLCSEEEP
ncbi:hypothetical protein CALVIDRAFT_596308 [Calocera viscosa TUFC12733]|uniref:Uncharacterized protein n=1 Tax=Calocera viscosa (strain TUFC12733) TaxID=1330018 RepID=A0A167PX25_CALVF|nr:hypothetical protein CALVIDRAFT_596308 [Calocera viscosa TUFC12733]